MSRFRSLFLFLLIPGIAAATPLLLFPAVTSQFGAAGFAAMAVGQSVGMAAGVICELAWSVLGPQAVAKMTREERSDYHSRSVATKVLALALGIPASFLITYEIVGGSFQLDAALIAASLSLAALNPTWLLVGMNRPGVILLSDVVPRVALNVGAAIAILYGAPLGIISAVNVAAIVASLSVTYRTTRVRIVPERRQYRAGLATVREHIPLTLGRSVTVGYTSLMTALVGVASPIAVAGFAATDRLLRMGLGVLGGFPNRLQSWVGSAPDGHMRARSRKSLLANLALGLVAGIVFYAMAPLVSTVLFTGQIAIRPEWAGIAGVTAFVVCLSRGFGLSLVAENLSNYIALANVVAAVAGISSVLLLTPQMGVSGALISVLLAELLGAVVQGLCLFWPRPNRPD